MMCNSQQKHTKYSSKAQESLSPAVELPLWKCQPGYIHQPCRETQLSAALVKAGKTLNNCYPFLACWLEVMMPRTPKSGIKRILNRILLPVAHGYMLRHQDQLGPLPYPLLKKTQNTHICAQWSMSRVC